MELHGIDVDSELAQTAKEIVQGIDLETLDTAAMEEELRISAAAATDLDGNPAPLVHTDGQLRQRAVHRLVAETLFAELDARGFTMTAGAEVSLYGQGTECR